MASKKKKNNTKQHTLSELQTLGLDLLSSRAHINNLPLLLRYVSSSSPAQHALESILSLQSFFTPLLPELPSNSTLADHDSSTNDPELRFRTWARSQLDQFLQSLASIALSSKSEDALIEVALDTVMEFVKLGRGGRFQSSIYHRFLHSIVHSTTDLEVLLNLLVSKFFNYVDVRFFTYVSMEKFTKNLEIAKATDREKANAHEDDEHISGSRSELAIHKMYYILSHIPPLEVEEGKSDYESWSDLGECCDCCLVEFLLLVSGNILMLALAIWNLIQFTSWFSTEKTKDNGTNEAPNVVNSQNKPKKRESGSPSTPKILKKIKLKFTKAWLAFLRLPLPLDLYKEVLVNLHQMVIPHLSNPILLCDFLTRSYDIGGVVSVMALSSLFILMTQHSLEYPNFYEKLYALLVPPIFMAKHRAKFFQLLDSCLKSSLLPAYLAAAFTKKLSRLALADPPSGALIIIALIHNLLRRHPSINFLVQWEVDDEAQDDVSRGEDELIQDSEDTAPGTRRNTSSKLSGIDPFNNEETDPAKSNAMRSSLWEIDMLRHHYCPYVSRFVESLENDLTVRSKTTEITITDFSSGSYATIFRNEIGRRVKQVPLAFYRTTPTCLFSESDFPGWTFKFGEAGKVENGNKENSVAAVSTEDEEKSAKRQRMSNAP
ncbi:hypothetical protein Sjap_009697 [Stephania japonica]|uniref:CCAAT-binding factor domain-containing protein n=1 Tax=Stephania japonica TaxID=461633 RepID=A0AAP0J9T0_9MAGN